MAVLLGYQADIYIATGTGTGFTAEACSSVTATVFQVDAATKRYWDPSTATIVYDGGVAVPDGLYQISWASGKIHFVTAPVGAVTVTGAYLSISQLGQAFEWNLDIEPQLQMSNTFGDSWEEQTCVNRKATVQVKRFSPGDGYFLPKASQYFVLALYEKQSTGARYLAMGRLSKESLSAAQDNLIGNDLTFASHGVVDYAAS